MNNPTEQVLSWNFNVPNTITLVRLALTAPIVWLVWQGGSAEVLLAGILLCIAWVTDGLDGFLARRRGESSIAGGLLDLGTDQIIIISTLMALIAGGYWSRTADLMPFTPYPYAAIVVAAGLAVIAGVLSFLWKRRTRPMEFPPPTQIAKISFSVQMPTLVVAVLGIGPSTGPNWLLATLMYLTIIILALSFYSYLKKGGYVFTD